MHYILPILLLLSICFSGCKQNKGNGVVSSDARVSTFTFLADTTNPGLTASTYKIEHRSDTGLIHSKDSLRFGTRLDSVVPAVTYMATPGLVKFVFPDTVITSTGVDTMNFEQKPIYLHVTASDMKTQKWYLIDIAAHKVDPHLYVWERLTDNLFSPKAVPNCHTKAFYIDHQLVLFVNDGLSTSIYQSANGEQWTCLASSVDALPIPCHVRDIVQHDNTLYYIDENSLYQSEDLITWSKTDYSTADFTPLNMLMSYNQKPWCIVQDKSNERLKLATIEDNTISIESEIAELPDGYLPKNFPVSDFAATQFRSSSERPRAMVVGGWDIYGNAVNTRWNFEGVKAPDNPEICTYRLKDFSISQPSFKSLIGVSVIQYNNHLIMIGGTDNNLAWRSDILYSYDEGMNWALPDSTSNHLPDTYEARSHQSVLVDSANHIYIIGGQTNTHSLGDVYKGFLNSIQWQ